MTNKSGLIISVILGLFFSASCKQSDKRSVEPVGNSTFEFQLNPPSQSSYSYDVRNETNMTQTVNENKIENETGLEMRVTYNVKQDTAGLYNFAMNYDQFKVRMKSGENEQEVDAATASSSADPIQRVFGAFKDAVIHIRTDKRSNVKGVDGVEKITENLRRLAGGDADALEMVNGAARQYVDAANIKSNFEKTFKTLPDTLLHEGNTWSVSTPLGAGINANIDNIYKIESIADGRAVISIAGKINMENQQMMIEKNRVTANLKGTQTGRIEIETATGMLIRSTAKVKVDGNFSLMGVEVPVKLTIENSTKRVERNK